MQTIKIYLQESGTVAVKKQDFNLYRGSFQNVLLNIIMPRSFLVEEFLTEAHTQIASPWNTYYVDGLPYGPIANPGMAAILGALRPEDTNFLFYALHIDGHHEFFRNFDQHVAFINTTNFAHHPSHR